MSDLPAPYPENRPRTATIRSRVMLEVASELAGLPDWEPKQARVQLRRQGGADWEITLFGSDSAGVMEEVAAGTVDFAIVNPATVAAAALRGVPPYPGPLGLAAIATIPSHDQFAVAVAPGAGIETLEDLAAPHGALRISLRGGRPDHSIHGVFDHLLAALGTSRQELVAGGDTITYDEGIPHQQPRAGILSARAADIVCDEGVYNWVDLALDTGFRFLPIPDRALEDLEAKGYRRSAISGQRYPRLGGGVATIDFSGFLIYTRAAMSDAVVTAFCRALVARRDRIPWQGGPVLPLERMVIDAPDAPVPIPFHPAALTVWQEMGLVKA